MEEADLFLPNLLKVIKVTALLTEYFNDLSFKVTGSDKCHVFFNTRV